LFRANVVVSAVVPPGLTAGGGLKQVAARRRYRLSRFPPASPPGAD